MAAVRVTQPLPIPWWTKITALTALLMLVGGLLTFTFKASAFVKTQDTQSDRIGVVEQSTAAHYLAPAHAGTLLRFETLDAGQAQHLEILRRIEGRVERLDADIDRLREDTAALCAAAGARCRR